MWIAIGLLAPTLIGAQRGQVKISTKIDPTEVIAWRPLSQSDFKGLRPPGDFGRSQVRPVAVTCAYLVPSPSARIFADLVADAPPEAAYRARVEGLFFHALMSPSCSWWNIEAPVSPAYVLQHEQIHFDIFEVAARRLNHDLPGRLAVAEIHGASVQEVAEKAQNFVQKVLFQTMEITGRRNHQFDVETSFGFELERQGSWRANLDRDLRSMDQFAREWVLPSAKKPQAGVDERSDFTPVRR